ncbi:MAG: peptidase, partial [bacterium]
SILKDVIKRGTGTRAKVLGRNDIAGKTGTTNGPRDAWFSGYGTGAVTTTWVGFDQNQLMGRGEYGGSAALPIWIDFMADALKGVPEVERPRPPRLVTARINPSTGQRVGPGESGSIFEYFLEENQPPMQDSIPGSDSRTPGALPEDIFQ